MRARDNGTIQVCVDNLLKTVKGEVPYSREKGISRNIVDIPHEVAEIKLISSADRCLEGYEPRINVREITTRTITPDGDVNYIVDARPSV